MSEEKSLINSYKDLGYVIIRKYFGNDDVKKINQYITCLKPVAKVPFAQNVTWGYGNLIENKQLKELININKISTTVRRFLSKGDPACNHIYVVNKPPFIGPEVEWHQEFFNINTYAPGYCPHKNFREFAQIFIALDKHQIENGPLYIFEGSHKEGLLSHEDIISPNLTHKRRVKYEELERISSIYKIKPILLEEGDALIFNHLLVHGSPTNCSVNRRRALLLQYRINKVKKDIEKYKIEENYRNNFMINALISRKEKIERGNLYKDQDPK